MRSTYATFRNRSRPDAAIEGMIAKASEAVFFQASPECLEIGDALCAIGYRFAIKYRLPQLNCSAASVMSRNCPVQFNPVRE